jgi:hypothetical protein
MLSRKELLEDNEELICLLNDLLICCEEQGCLVPDDIMERVKDFLIVEDADDGDDVIDVTPTRN